MSEDPEPATDRWAQRNRCPTCDREMRREAAVGEKLGLFYRCDELPLDGLGNSCGDLVLNLENILHLAVVAL